MMTATLAWSLGVLAALHGAPAGGAIGAGAAGGVLAAAAARPAAEAARSAAALIGDYDAELRRPDGHVDTAAMIRRLKELGVDCYMWLIWHAPTDWADLHDFLPAAKAAGIDVWVYLTPPSEPPPPGPFGYDYVRWGQEIAKLSLTYPNLRGWVIDDFYANHARLTPAYIGQAQKAAKAINPRLVFFPLMYYPEIGAAFVDDYGPVVDGAVVAYPTSREEIAWAGRVLRGEDAAGGQVSMCYPWSTPSKPGDFGEVSCRLKVVPGARAYRIGFRERDDFSGPTEGFHVKQVLIDGQVAWEGDVAGGGIRPRGVTVDVGKLVRGKSAVSLALRCYDKKGVSNFGVDVEWSDLRLEGLEGPAKGLASKAGWETSGAGAWTVAWRGAGGGARLRPLPYVVMVAATKRDLIARLPGSKGTPAEVGAHLAMALRAMAAGQCDGVVTYCLPKQPGSAYFDAAEKAIAKAKAAMGGKAGGS